MNEQLKQIAQVFINAVQSGDPSEAVLLLQAAQQDLNLALAIQQLAQDPQVGLAIQAVILMVEGGAQAQEGPAMARNGAKLAYIAQLRGICPQGTEMKYYREGGRVCRKCEATVRDLMKQEIPSDPIEAFKCGNKIKKGELGTPVKKPVERTVKEGWDKHGNYIVTNKGIEQRKRELANNNTPDEGDPGAGADYGRRTILLKPPVTRPATKKTNPRPLVKK